MESRGSTDLSMQQGTAQSRTTKESDGPGPSLALPGPPMPVYTSQSKCVHATAVAVYQDSTKTCTVQH